MAEFQIEKKGVFGKEGKMLAVGDTLEVVLKDGKVPAYLAGKGKLLEVATPAKSTTK